MKKKRKINKNTGKTISVDIKYSLNGGSWIDGKSLSTIKLNRNDRLSIIASDIDFFTASGGLVDIYGNIMSLIYGDDFADSGEYNLEITNMYLTDGESEIPVITDIYYKIEGEWLSNENAGQYVAGSNISIDGNVISADLSSRIPTSEKGTASGVAELDANGKVPIAQLPSFVDDVIEGYLYNGAFYEDSAHQTLITPQDGKIYIDLTTEKTYRWSGSAYVEISESLALGETSSTAYRGDRGKTAYDHSQLTSGNPHNVTKSDVGLGNVGNFKAVSTVANQGLSTTEKANARANIGSPTKTSDLQNDSNFVADANYEHLPLTVVNGKLCIVYEQ